MKKVKIYGAGSIGNHLAHACRNKGWDVLICDKDSAALERTRSEIYPGRYGAWDGGIELKLAGEAPVGGFDLVIIGTPPDSHLSLADRALKEDRPAIILVEKPFCPPDLEGAHRFSEDVSRSKTEVLVGYNHALGENTTVAEKLLKETDIGDHLTITARFQEYWGGIFKAHQWLDGPKDSYLGFSNRGGGAGGEHSHAINIWQHFAHVLGFGKITEVSACMDFVEDGEVAYDRMCDINVRTQMGMCGLIRQDVITEPSKKSLRIQATDGWLEWHVNWDLENDLVAMEGKEGAVEMPLPKKRPDDFRREIDHVEQVMDGQVDDSPISLERGLDTMMVLAAAHLSFKEKRVMRIDYSRYNRDSIHPL